MKIAVLLLALITILFGGTSHATEQVLFYHTDPAGTPLAMTDTSGNVVWQADYRPFGEEQSVTGSATNARRFVGKEKDEETGLSYFGARYMQDKTGRFIAADPIGAVDEKTSKTNEKLLLNPQRLNSYAYGLNNPYRYVDPDGRDPYLAFSSEPNLALRCHVNPHWDRNENLIGGVALTAALTSVAIGPEIVAWSRQLGAEPIPTAVQDNFKRFVKKIPSNSKTSATIEAVEGGNYRFVAESPGRIPGSKAIYEKTVNNIGETIKYIKTTIEPTGKIAHIKNKF